MGSADRGRPELHLARAWWLTAVPGVVVVLVVLSANRISRSVGKVGDERLTCQRAGTPLLGIDGPRDRLRGRRQGAAASSIDVSLPGRPGEVVALVGESGSGKTTTAQAVIGLLAENGRVESGEIRLNGTDIARWSQKRLDTIAGPRISLIPQDPGELAQPGADHRRAGRRGLADPRQSGDREGDLAPA